MSIVENQARRALDGVLRPGETVRGFTLCEYDNGRQTVQAFSRRAVSKGFLAITDDRLFLIPTRVRDLMAWPFSQVQGVRLPADELLTIDLGNGVTLGMTLNDPRVGRAVMDRFMQMVALGRETFETVFRTPDFEENVDAEMAKYLAAGAGWDEAVHSVAVRTKQIVASFGADQFVASAAAFAAAQIAQQHGLAGEPA